MEKTPLPPPSYVTLKQLQERRLKEKEQEEKPAMQRPLEAAEVKEVRGNRRRGRRLPRTVPKQPSAKPQAEEAWVVQHRSRPAVVVSAGVSRSCVTLKQLQELRRKEKQDEEDRRLREVNVAHHQKAAEERPPGAADVDEVRRNRPRGRHLLRPVVVQPFAKPEAEKARGQVRSHPGVEVADGAPKSYVTLKQLQELRLKEKQDDEDRRLRELKEVHEEKSAEQSLHMVTEVKRVRKGRRKGPHLFRPGNKQPSEKFEGEKNSGQDRSHPAVGVTATVVPKNYVTLKQLQELRLKEEQNGERHRLGEREESHEKNGEKVEEFKKNWPRDDRHLQRGLPKQPSAKLEAEKAGSQDRSQLAVDVAAGVPPNYVTLKQLHELRLKEKQNGEHHRLRELEEPHEENGAKQRPPGTAKVKKNRRNRRRDDGHLLQGLPKQPSSKLEAEKAGSQDRSHPAAEVTAGVPPNYVTLKQLQELRLKEKQDGEERRLRKLQEAHDKNAAKQRPPMAAEVEEVRRNRPRDDHLLQAVPKQPSSKSEVEKSCSQDQSRSAVEVAAGVPRQNYITLKHLQELCLKEKRDVEERHLTETHKENAAKQRPTEAAKEVEEVRRNRPREHQFLGAITEEPSTNHVPEKKTREADEIHPAAKVVAADGKTDDAYKTKPDAAKETKPPRIKSVWITCVPPQGTPVGPVKKVPEGIPSPEEGQKEAAGTSGAEVERRAAETRLDNGIACAETQKRTGGGGGNIRERADGRRSRRGWRSGGGGGLVWKRKTKPGEIVE